MKHPIFSKYNTNACCFSLFVVMLGVALAGCKKQKEVSPEFAVLRIYGAFHAYGPVIGRLDDTEPFSYSWAVDLNSHGVERKRNVYENEVPFTLHAVPDTLPGHKPVFSMILKLEKRTSYTFICGGQIASMDTMFFREPPLPYFEEGDSVCAFRFINFMADGPVNIIHKGATDKVVAADLPYKGITGFITVPVTRSLENMNFEMRDAATDELLATYSKPIWPLVGNQQYLYKVYSVLLKGVRGTSGYSKPDLTFSRMY